MLQVAGVVGAVGAALIALGSYGAGAIRYRGGVADAVGLVWLTYGHGANVSNVAFWSGLTLLVAGWVLLGKGAIFDAGGVVVEHVLRTRAVVRCVVLWTVPLVFAAPVLSRDVYSYLMQGAMTRDGFDAYSQGAIADPGVYLYEVSHDWRTTTTPYGPLHLFIGKVVTSIAGDNVSLGVVLFKALAVFGFVLIGWTSARIAVELGGNPALALWLGAANPVVLTHLIGGLHNEALMVGASGVAVLLAVRRRLVLATAVLAVAIAIKATAIIILPFFAWMAVDRLVASRSLGWGFPARVGAAVGAGVALAAELLAVLAVITAVTRTSWGWVGEISGNGKVINPLAAPSFVAGAVIPYVRLFDEDASFNTVLALTRVVSGVLLLVGLAACWFVFHGSARRAVAGMVAAFAVATVFNAVALPWYYISPLALVGAVRPSRRVVGFVVWASIVVGMSFTASGNHKLYDAPWIVPLGLLAWGVTLWLLGARVPLSVRVGSASQR
ncbi:hypothetical protein CAQU_08500 [Corynebacterium aquilae DSM 44791]|uniref:Alpha-(1->6)-mannopyranosyltransferase A n=1 Tax=Corynebacterium aquilae DSM 44791 TaxID=1431546 RepID=A0A1L7CGW1_9CORY|nr:hypothetical protein CAQU_08500 [Corynebacterium aquilae DSM 44791]